jgi:hypothetical protein
MINCILFYGGFTQLMKDNADRPRPVIHTIKPHEVTFEEAGRIVMTAIEHGTLTFLYDHMINEDTAIYKWDGKD